MSVTNLVVGAHQVAHAFKMLRALPGTIIKAESVSGQTVNRFLKSDRLPIFDRTNQGFEKGRTKAPTPIVPSRQFAIAGVRGTDATDISAGERVITPL